MGTAEGQETCRQYWTSNSTSEYRMLSKEEYRLITRKTAFEMSVDIRRLNEESRQRANDDYQQQQKTDGQNGQYTPDGYRQNLNGSVDDSRSNEECHQRADDDRQQQKTDGHKRQYTSEGYRNRSIDDKRYNEDNHQRADGNLQQQETERHNGKYTSEGCRRHRNGSIDDSRSSEESHQRADVDSQQQNGSGRCAPQEYNSGVVDDCNIDNEKFVRNDNRLSDDNKTYSKTNESKGMSTTDMNSLHSKSGSKGGKGLQCNNGDRQLQRDFEVNGPDTFGSNKLSVLDHCKHTSSNTFTSNKEVVNDEVHVMPFVSSNDQMLQLSNANNHQVVCRTLDVSSADIGVRSWGQSKTDLVGKGFLKRRRFARIDRSTSPALYRKIAERASEYRATSTKIEESLQIASDINSCEDMPRVPVSELVKYFENFLALGRKSPRANKSEEYHNQSSKEYPRADLEVENNCVNSIYTKEANSELLSGPKNPEMLCSTSSYFPQNSRAQEKEEPILKIEIPQANNKLTPENEYSEQNITAISFGIDAVSKPFILDPKQDGGCDSSSQQIQRTDVGMMSESILHTDPDSLDIYPGIISEQIGPSVPDNQHVHTKQTMSDIFENSSSESETELIQGKTIVYVDIVSEESNRLKLDNPNIPSEQICLKTSGNLDKFSNEEDLKISGNLDNVLELKRLKMSDKLKNSPKQEGQKMCDNSRGEGVSVMKMNDSNITKEATVYLHTKNTNVAKNEKLLVDENTKYGTSATEPIGDLRIIPRKFLNPGSENCLNLPKFDKSNVSSTSRIKKNVRLQKLKERGCAKKLIISAIGVFVFYVFLLNIYNLRC